MILTENLYPLERTHEKTVEVLPKMRGRRRKPKTLLPLTRLWMARFGTVHPQYKRCGKASCRCAEANGSRLHGPYYYHFERINGRQYKRYIPMADAPVVVAANRQRVEEQQAWEAQRRADLAAIREIRASLRAGE
jgi:hypothetical protein